MKTLLRSVLASTLVFSLVAPAARAGEQLTRLYLTRPSANAPDLDAKGWVRIRSDAGSGRQRFDVKISKVQSSDVVTLLMEDPENPGIYTSIGALDGGSSKKLVFDTKKGDSLPYGVSMVSELSGLGVILAYGANPDLMDPIVLVSGVVPEFVAKSKTKSGKEKLDPFPSSQFKSTSHGDVVVKANDKGGLQRMLIKVKGLGFQSFTYTFFLADEFGEMQEVGPMIKYAKKKARFLSNAKQGDPMPLDVLYLQELVGRKIEIRDQNGQVHMQEFVPPLN